MKGSNQQQLEGRGLQQKMTAVNPCGWEWQEGKTCGNLQRAEWEPGRNGNSIRYSPLNGQENTASDSSDLCYSGCL